MAIDFSNLSLDQLKRAVILKEQIVALGNELAVILGTSNPALVSGKRFLSEATKARMRAAHQARWAKLKGVKAPATPEVVKRGPGRPKGTKNKVNPEGRANLIAAQKATGAKIKTEKAAPNIAAQLISKLAVKPKRKISAEARRRMVEGGKARWAKAKAGK